MVSSSEVTNRILTAIHKNSSKRLSHRRGTEFKEIGLLLIKTYYLCALSVSVVDAREGLRFSVFVTKDRFCRTCFAPSLSGDATARPEHAVSQVWQGVRCPSNNPSRIPSGKPEDPQEFHFSFFQEKIVLGEPVSQLFPPESESAVTCRGSSASHVP